MLISQMLHSLEAYLNRRATILRALHEQSLSPSELMDLLGVGYNVIALRRRNPALWRPNELEQLATVFRISSEAISGLTGLTARINLLPAFVRAKLLKEACLNNQKIIRYHDYTCWPYADLERLACVLRIWQDSHKLESLLATSRNRYVSLRKGPNFGS